MPKSEHISFRCTPTDRAKLKRYMDEQNIKKESSAVQKIVQEFFEGGLTAKPQKLPPTPKEVGSEVVFPSHVRLGTVNPMLTREVQRFMRGKHSPIIAGLLSIDELSIRQSCVAGNDSGIISLIPATTHDTGA